MLSAADLTGSLNGWKTELEELGAGQALLWKAQDMPLPDKASTFLHIKPGTAATTAAAAGLQQLSSQLCQLGLHPGIERMRKGKVTCHQHKQKGQGCLYRAAPPAADVPRGCTAQHMSLAAAAARPRKTGPLLTMGTSIRAECQFLLLVQL